MQPCYKEEADDPLFPYVTEQSWLGFKRLMVVTVNTDMVVIDFYAYWDPDVAEVSIEFDNEKFADGCQFILMLRKSAELLSFGMH